MVQPSDACGAVIRHIRGARHLAQSKLAEAADCDRSYLVDLETGRYSNPTVGFVCRLLDVLDHEVIVRPKGATLGDGEYRVCPERVAS